MKIHDSKSRKKVAFEPLEDGKVGIYLCGPTPYDVAHLGHGRSAVAFDVIRKYFEYKGYEVNFVSNYTDIDDKTINRANEEGISVKKLVDQTIPEYEKDYEALGIAKPTVQPKATEHIDAIIEIIGKLEEKGFTYVLDDGVYYDVSKFPKYGQLSNQKLEDLRMGSRVKVKEEKKNPYDFVLWKFKKEGEPSWESKWGEGRPGWHIECSAMSAKCLGERFDIHGGGLDLLFPHHECEVAQSCGADGMGSFAKYWLHNGFINVDDEKMSKSLGNFFTLKEIFEKYDPVVVRFMFLQTHYRNPINFSDKLLDQAKAGLERVHGFMRRLGQDFEESDVSKGTEVLIEETKDAFVANMDNDFDTSGALGVVFDFMKKCNSLIDEGKFTAEDVELVVEFLNSVDRVFGIFGGGDVGVDSEEIEKLIAEREAARAAKDFGRADEIRDELREKGIELEDSERGTSWRKG